MEIGQKAGFAEPEYRPSSKSYLFLTKLRRISSIDRNLRKKWSQLQQQRIRQYQDRETKYLNAIRVMMKDQSQSKQLLRYESQSHDINSTSPQKQTEKLDRSLQYIVNVSDNTLPTRPNKLREQIRREEARMRKKHYDDIYYKKKNRKIFSEFKSHNIQYKLVRESDLSRSQDKHLQNSQNSSPQKYLTQLNRLKTEGDLPHHLKRRKATKEKEIQILNRLYNNQIKAINVRKNYDEVKNCEHQTDMLRKIKGKKFYYKFTSSWSSKIEQNLN